MIRALPRWWLWALPAAALLATFLLWPLGELLRRGAVPQEQLTLEAVRAVVGDRYYWERLAFTTAQAAASTVLAVALGLPVAYVFARLRFPGRDVLRAVVTVPFVLPTLVVALAFQQLLGPQGWINDALALVGVGPVQPLGTVWAILLAHVFYNLAVAARLIGAVWSNLDPRTEEAARMLSASRVATFRRVTLPALAPAIYSAAALIFTFAFTSFGVVLVLGGGDPQLDTLEVVIFRLATRLVELPAAAVLALVQILATGVALVVYALLQRRAAVPWARRAEYATPLSEASTAQRALAAVVLAGLLTLVVAPLAALVHGALTVGASGPVSGAHFARLFEDTGRVSFIGPGSALRWSLTFAVGASLLAALVGLTAATALARARGRIGVFADAVLMLPLAVPAVVLGFGYLVTFNRGLLDLRGSPWLLLAAHALIGYPFVVRAVVSVLRTLDPQLAEAARALGATPWRAWLHVELPIAMRGLLAGALFAFAVSLGEFGATALLQRREFATIPIAIYEALGRPGDANVGRALALSTLLMFVTAAAFLVIERVRYREASGF